MDFHERTIQTSLSVIVDDENDVSKSEYINSDSDKSNDNNTDHIDVKDSKSFVYFLRKH